jgi:hypothetical protein
MRLAHPRLREMALSVEARLGPAGSFLVALIGGLAFILSFVAAGGLVVWIAVSGWRLAHPVTIEARLPQAAPSVSMLRASPIVAPPPASPPPPHRRHHRQAATTPAGAAPDQDAASNQAQPVASAGPGVFVAPQASGAGGGYVAGPSAHSPSPSNAAGSPP